MLKEKEFNQTPLLYVFASPKSEITDKLDSDTSSYRYAFHYYVVIVRIIILLYLFYYHPYNNVQSRDTRLKPCAGRVHGAHAAQEIIKRTWMKLVVRKVNHKLLPQKTLKAWIQN